MTIDIVIADDHPIFLDGLRSLISSEPDLTVVAQVESGDAAISAVRQMQPTVLVSDISMNGTCGIETARQVRAISPATKILILTMHADRRSVLAALDAGADGYVLKESTRRELITAVRAITDDYAYLSPAISNYVVDAATGTDEQACRSPSRLTTREVEVLRLIAGGQSTKEVAHSLGVSPKTISTHREHVMKKLNLHGVAELTRYALREGLVVDE